MDTVFIEKLILKARVGIHPWEQAISQKIALDISLGTDLRQAAASDNIQDTLDYAKIAALIKKHVDTQPYALLERLAENLTQLLFTEFPIKHIKLSITKLSALSNASGVGVRIERFAPAQ